MKLVKEGYYDLTVKDSNGCEGRYVKSIICVNNARLKALIEDLKFEGILELSEKCDLNTFNEAYKLYGGGKMSIYGENVIKLLKFSICYDDKCIKTYCVSYAIDYINEKIICELMQIEDLIRLDNDLKILNEKINEYLVKKGYLLLGNDEFLQKTKIEYLERILKNEKLVVNKNETWLLNRLLRWYKYNNDKCEEEQDKMELQKEYKELIRKSIKSDKILIDLIDEDLKKEYSELEKYLLLNSKIIHIYVNEKFSNEKLIEIIFDFLSEKEKDSINEEDKNQLNKESLKSNLIIDLLKSNDDIKLVEIILNIIIEMRWNNIIPPELKNELLLELLHNYKRNKRNGTLKCFCLFVDDKKNIITIENLCGKEILYKILNNEYYLNSKSKELLIKYIEEMKLSYEEEKEMIKIINNKELSKEIIQKIASYLYPKSQYSFPIYEEISIIPSFDGSKCEFSINPSLPSGIILDSESGIIHGKVENEIEKKEYEIICKNKISEKKFKISLEFVDIKFTELNKSENISISNNGKLITKTKDGCNHCYLNLKMENGIYHIKYKLHQNGRSYDNIMLGLSTDNTYSGYSLFNQSTTCNYYANGGKSQDITSYCKIGTIVNKNPNFNNHGDNSIYEVIVDMNKREFSICHNNSSPVVLVKDLPSPLYPYVYPYYQNLSVELLSVSHHN